MNAVTQIAIQPVQKPRYVNRNVGHFQRWYRDNEPALTQYFNALPGEGDFLEFAMCQHDVEEESEIAAREKLDLIEAEAHGTDVDYHQYCLQTFGARR
jgi:hypothetical protein